MILGELKRDRDTFTGRPRPAEYNRGHHTAPTPGKRPQHGTLDSNARWGQPTGDGQKGRHGET